MEEIKTKKNLNTKNPAAAKATGYTPLRCAFLLSRASVLNGFPMALRLFCRLVRPKAMYIYLPIMVLGSISAGANVLKYFIAALVYWFITELRVRTPQRFVMRSAVPGLSSSRAYRLHYFPKRRQTHYFFLL